MQTESQLNNSPTTTPLAASAISTSAISPTLPENAEEPPDTTIHSDPLLNTEPMTKSANDGQRNHDVADRERTKSRYEKAAKDLEKSLKLCQRDWQPFDLPKFDDILNNDALPDMQEAVTNMLNVREQSMKNPDFWSKRKGTIKRIFSATSPFAKSFLQVAKQGSSVPHSLFYRSSRIRSLS
jgi:hypothetical protein